MVFGGKEKTTTLNPVSGHYGNTSFPVKWHIIKEQDGSRLIEGIAYNAAIPGERRRVTCSEKTWNDPDDDVFYWDEAVRWTVDELKKLDLVGKPLRVQHQPDEELPSVGEIVANYVDNEGHLHIIGNVPAGNKFQNAVISLIDNDVISDLSIGYPLERNKKTGEVVHLGVDEVSFVTDGHFRGCKVSLKANERKPGPDLSKGPFSFFRVVRASLTDKKENPTDAEERNLEFLKKVKNITIHYCS